MKFTNTFKFFFSQIEKKNWFFIIFNYFLVLVITFCDVIFFSIFYLILNKKIESKFINSILDNSNFFISKYSLSFDLDKFYIILLLFFLIFKNILTFLQTYFYGNFIHNITLNKSSQVLESYFDLDFSSFNKKEISIYIKQVLRDVESAFLGIFGIIISFFGEITYLILLIVYLDYLVGLSINIKIIFLFMFLVFIIYYLFKTSEKLGKLRADNEIRVFKTLSDILSIFRELKLNNQSKVFIDRFRSFLKNYYNSKIYSGLINIAPKLILEFFEKTIWKYPMLTLANVKHMFSQVNS
jgi:ABC-type multidrug transport system fused ATPase/permease subunit